MPRELPPSFLSVLSQKEVYPFFAVDLSFIDQSVNPPIPSPLYLWSGYGDLVRVETGNTYLGAGQFLNVSSVGETTEIEAKGATLSLSGIPSEFLALALTQPYQGRECKIYLGLTSEAKYLLAQDSDFLVTQAGDFILSEDGGQGFVEIFSGELDQMTISEASETASISITAENILIKLDRPVIRRFTDADQKSRFSSDLGFNFIAGLQDKEIFWGKKTP